MSEDSVVRALGEMQGTVRSMSEQWRRQEEAAINGRQGLYDRFEKLSEQVMRMSHAVDAVTQDVAELHNDIRNNVKPTIDNYRMEVARRVGMLWAGRMLWTILVGAAGAIGFAVHEMIKFFIRE
jgi:seryl-tRNA synthetase